MTQSPFNVYNALPRKNSQYAAVNKLTVLPNYYHFTKFGQTIFVREKSFNVVLKLPL